MKRAITLILAALFALFSGVEYVVPKNDEFVLNTETSHAYWSPSNNEDYDYATLYRMQFGSTGTVLQPCDTQTVTPHREYGWSSQSPYCPVHSDEWSEDPTDANGVSWADFAAYARNPSAEAEVKSWSYVGSGEFNITAPYTGNILTSHYACNYGHKMEFQFTINEVKYTMRVDNAKCWWCCRLKDVSDGYYTATTKDSLKNREMPSGALLLIGKEGTTVYVSRAT